MTAVPVTEAKSRFSEFLSRTIGGERFVIERRGIPVAALISQKELLQLERMADFALQLAQALGKDEALLEQIAAGEQHPAIAAYGLWKDDDFLDKLQNDIYKNREQASTRAEVDL